MNDQSTSTLSSSTAPNRLLAADIARVYALICVPSIHFYLNNGFYSQNVAGIRMFVMIIHRTFLLVCVPLFMVLTGYLSGGKTLSRGCYSGLRKNIMVYILSCAACIVYRFLTGAELSVLRAVFSILDFSAAPYSWYVKMYIGLALLSPFLNILYHGLETRKKKQCLLAVMLVLTAVPGILNCHDFFTAGWLLNPSSSTTYQTIFPNWWTGVYPLTYYFIGCYLREYPPKVKKRHSFSVYCGTSILAGAYNFYRCHGVTHSSTGYLGWGDLPVVILTVSVFILILSLPSERFPPWSVKLLERLSGLCLGAYLVSWVFDDIFYPKLNAAVPVMPLRLNYFFLIVPPVIILSFALSWLLSLIQRALASGACALRNKFL